MGHLNFHCAVFPTKPNDLFQLLLHFPAFTVHFQQHKGLLAGIQTDLQKVFHSLNGHLVHNFNGGGHNPCADDGAYRPRRCVQIIILSQRCFYGLRLGQKPHRNAGDNGQGTL